MESPQGKDGPDGWPSPTGEAEIAALKRQVRLVARLTRLPFAALFLIVLFSVMHFWVACLAGGAHERAVFHVLVSGAKVNGLVEAGEWWRLVSSAFLHGTFSHLAVNALGVLLLGWFLENSLGKMALLVTFTASAVVGSGLSYLLTTTPSVGASGGMFGLLGATLSYSLARWRALPRFIRSYVVGLPAAVGIFSLVYGFAAGNVDNFAHVGGGVFGGLIGLAFSVVPEARTEGARFVCALSKAAFVIILVYCLGATVARMQMRFDLPQTRLAVSAVGRDLPVYYPGNWHAGVFREGKCETGARISGEDDIACFIDPFYTMFLVAPAEAIMGTPVFSEYVRRRLDQEPGMYEHDRILWGSDHLRGVEFALLAFDDIAHKYLPLFAALQTEPER